MFVPAGLSPADLAALEPDHGTPRRYRVTLTNTYTGASETYEVEAVNCARAKGAAQRMMSADLCADWGMDPANGDYEPKGVLHNDVVRL